MTSRRRRLPGSPVILTIATLAITAAAPALSKPPAGPQGGAADARSTLRVRVVLIDGDQKPAPVPGHVLLVSDNPPTAAPRVIRTGADGTATVRLRPGNYTVESEQPVAFQGKAYEWRQTLDIASGRDAVLDLTAGNAEVAAAVPPGAAAVGSPEHDPSALLLRWQDSVVAVWSPTARASGFVIDARGLVVTNQRGVGGATSVEVQITPAIKLAGRVLAADPVRDVAVVWIDPKTAASLPAVPLACTGPAAASPVEDGEEIVAIGAPLRRARAATSATVQGIEGRVIVADVVPDPGSAGGPVFTREGRLVGISSIPGEDEDGAAGESRVIRVEEVCAAVAAAEPAMKDAAAPDAAPLPVEPARPFPIAPPAAPAAPALDAHRLSSSDYDVTFITPVLLQAARQPAARDRAGAGRVPDPREIDPLDDFANWRTYVRDEAAVLMIRVTPKLTEGFWTKVARGAAQTQGVSLPPIKRFKPGFARLQAFCGEAEVTPIHPFKLVQRVSEAEAIYEGLYVFDPDALGPPCGTVRLVLYSEKAPQQGETRVVEAKVLRRIWDDFAPYRAGR